MVKIMVPNPINPWMIWGVPNPTIFRNIHAAAGCQVPITLLTGFLGAGKTVPRFEPNLSKRKLIMGNWMVFLKVNGF